LAIRGFKRFAVLFSSLFDERVINVIGRIPVKTLGNPLKIGLAGINLGRIFKIC
jgi:hypothetical protein